MNTGPVIIESICGCGPRHFSRRGPCDVCGEKILLRKKTGKRREDNPPESTP